MPYQDYCHKWLDTSVWQSSENHIQSKVRGPLLHQLTTRFPDVKAFFVVGRLTGHYYNDESTLDLLAVCPKERIKPYTAEAKLLEGHAVAPSSPRTMVMVFVPSSVSIQVLAGKFGPLYDLRKDVWLGRREVFGISELAAEDALLRSINWELYKLRKTASTSDVDPTLFLEGFSELPLPTKYDFIGTVKTRAKELELLTEKALTKYPKETWKAVDVLNLALAKEGNTGTFLDQLTTLSDTPTVPEPILNLVFHRHRYLQLATAFTEVLETLKEQARNEERSLNLPIEAATMPSPTRIYKIVRIEGSSRAVRELKASLISKKVRIASSSRTSLCLASVKAEDVPKLNQFLSRRGDFLVELLEPVSKEAEVAPTAQQIEAAAPLTLVPQKWYFAESKEDVYPFVFVKEINGSNATIEMVSALNTLPTKVSVSVNDLAAFGLRPATQEDFEDRDLPPPEARFVFEKEAAVQEEALSRPFDQVASTEPTLENFEALLASIKELSAGPNPRENATQIFPLLRDLHRVARKAFPKPEEETRYTLQDLDLALLQLDDVFGEEEENLIGLDRLRKFLDKLWIRIERNLADLKPWLSESPVMAVTKPITANLKYWNTTAATKKTAQTMLEMVSSLERYVTSIRKLSKSYKTNYETIRKEAGNLNHLFEEFHDRLQWKFLSNKQVQKYVDVVDGDIADLVRTVKYGIDPKQVSFEGLKEDLTSIFTSLQSALPKLKKTLSTLELA